MDRFKEILSLAHNLGNFAASVYVIMVTLFYISLYYLLLSSVLSGITCRMKLFTKLTILNSRTATNINMEYLNLKQNFTRCMG